LILYKPDSAGFFVGNIKNRSGQLVVDALAW